MRSRLRTFLVAALVAAPVFAQAPAGSKSLPPLTVERLNEVVLKIDFYEPTGASKSLASVLAQAKALLGEPTFVGKGTYTWGVVTKKTCASMQIEDKAGKGYTRGVISADDSEGHNTAYDACLETLGKPPRKKSH